MESSGPRRPCRRLVVVDGTGSTRRTVHATWIRVGFFAGPWSRVLGSGSWVPGPEVSGLEPGSASSRLLGVTELLENLLEGGDDFRFLDARLVEVQFEIELLGRRTEGEHVVLGSACLGLGRGLAD